MYEGNYIESYPNGKGILFYENGKKQYEGEFKKNLKDGKGI